MYPAAAVQRGILNEADALCLGAMDTASALLGSMRPSDYSYLRGQVTTCNNLMSGPLGETKGVGLAFSIDSHADVRAGSQKYFFGIRSALVWLRDTVWKGLLDEGEMNDMPGVFSGTLTHDANFKQSMRIVKSHVMLEKCDPDHVCYAHCAHGNASTSSTSFCLLCVDEWLFERMQCENRTTYQPAEGVGIIAYRRRELEFSLERICSRLCAGSRCTALPRICQGAALPEWL